MKKDLLLILYIFFAVFQPPILPINLIYIMGFITVWLLNKENKYEIRNVAKQSNITNFTHFIYGLTVYFFLLNFVNIVFIEEADLTATRLRCFNQLFVLSLIQCLFVIYIIIQCEKRQYLFKDVIILLIKAGVLQGLCAVIAYVVPSIREIFLMFGDRALYDNAFFLERRGYGFSMTLIDTFGYGMGLIAGYLFIYKWNNRKLLMFFSLLLMLFTIAVNARTGIVVFGIAVLLRCLRNASFFKMAFYSVVLFLTYAYLDTILFSILDAGVHSDNSTLVWICEDFMDIYYMTMSSDVSDSIQMEDVTFLSNFVEFPENTFEYFFGSGHYVYDTKKELGFRTDIGYFNMFWEFGILGSAYILFYFLKLLGRPIFFFRDKTVKFIAVLNLVAYAFLMMKAILLGYNPGVFINYLVTFSLYYYARKDNV